MVKAQTDRELLDLEVLRRRDRDPLFWTAPLSNATVFLLVRDDLGREDALAASRQRVSLIPPLARAAREAFEVADPSTVAPEHARLAAGQVSSLARFYAEGFAQAFAPAERGASARGPVRIAGSRGSRRDPGDGGEDGHGPRATRLPLCRGLSRGQRAHRAAGHRPAPGRAGSRGQAREMARYARSVFAEVTGETGAPPPATPR